MTGAFDLSILFGSPESLVAQHEDRLARLADLRREVAAAAGEAVSADGRVQVRYTEEDGIVGLTVDPRALRLPAEDLADLITGTVNEAKRAAAAAVLEASGRARRGGVPDPESVLAEVPRIEEMLAEVTADTGRMTDQLQALMDRLSAGAGPGRSPGPAAQWSAS
jgi:DNA-binding protein YbaB